MLYEEKEMSDKRVNAQEIIDGLQLAANKPIGESFTLAGSLSADKNKIKSGDRCLNLIGSNLVVYSGDTEEQKKQRGEILTLLNRLLQTEGFRAENAEAVRNAVHCALQTERAMLSDLQKELAAGKQEKLLNARANLYAIMNEIWQGIYATDNAEKICDWCFQIKKVAPDDFVANFCEELFGKDRSGVVAFFEKNLMDRSDDEILFVLRTMVNKLDEAYFTPLDYWIEELQNRKNPLFNYFHHLYEREKEKVERGVYDPEVKRDVFIAFSRQDIETVVAVKNYLEGNGLKCFLSTTNLRQCDGDEFPNAIKTAMDRCSVFVLISSKNSRMRRHDGRFCAYEEMKYLRDKELAQYRLAEKDVNAEYAAIPRKYKMMRVEYLVDAHEDKVGDELTKEFFDGVNPCSGLDANKGRAALYKAISHWLNHKADWTGEAVATSRSMQEEEQAKEDAAVIDKTDGVAPSLKYCASCFAPCKESVKFCPKCGKSLFVSSLQEAKARKSGKFCVNCLARNEKSVNYCVECGSDTFASTVEKASYLNEKAKKKQEKKDAVVRAREDKINRKNLLVQAEAKAEKEKKEAKAEAKEKLLSRLRGYKSEIIAFSFFTVSVVIGIVLIYLYSSLKSWQMQNIVGAIGALTFLVDLVGILYLSDNNWTHLGVFVFGVVLILNTVLAFMLSAWYKVISYWMNSYLIVMFIIIIGVAPSYDKNFCSVFSIAEIALAIGSLLAVGYLA